MGWAFEYSFYSENCRKSCFDEIAEDSYFWAVLEYGFDASALVFAVRSFSFISLVLHCKLVDKFIKGVD